jgi:phage gp46-like protein
MNGLQNFEGDLLLYETNDGGDTSIENGLFISDKQFSTAAYLSLFGGNKTDNGKVNNTDEYWGNYLNDITESEKLRSRFQYITTGLPMSVKNIKEAEKAAIMDLQWFIKENIADEVTAYGQAIGKNRFKLIIEILKDKNTLFKNEYFLLWGGGNGDTLRQ